MPRVYLSEQQRLNDRLARWLVGEMKLQGISQRQLAESRGVTQQALSKKIKSRSFDFEDVCCFIRVLKPEIDEVKRFMGMEK